MDVRHYKKSVAKYIYHKNYIVKPGSVANVVSSTLPQSHIANWNQYTYTVTLTISRIMQVNSQSVI